MPALFLLPIAYAYRSPPLAVRAPPPLGANLPTLDCLFRRMQRLPTRRAVLLCRARLPWTSTALSREAQRSTAPKSLPCIFPLLRPPLVERECRRQASPVETILPRQHGSAPLLGCARVLVLRLLRRVRPVLSL